MMGPDIKVRMGIDIETMYITSDGKEFKNERLALIHERPIAKRKYYEKMLSERNFIQRLFNIKPDMSFYNRVCIHCAI